MVKTVDQMVEHAKNMKKHNDNMYGQLIRLWKKCAAGEDGGQFEPWNPMPIRQAYYPDWSNDDFYSALVAVDETE